MDKLIIFIVPIIVLCIIIPKQHKIKDLHDVVKYSEFTSKLVFVLLFLAFCLAMIFVIISLEGDIEMLEILKSISADFFTSVLGGAVVSVVGYFLILKKLPDRIEKQVNDTMEIKVLNINQHTDVCNNTLSKQYDHSTRTMTRDHSNLSYEHHEIKDDIKSLVADMNRRQGSSTTTDDAINCSIKLQETLITQYNTIKDLTENNYELTQNYNKLKQVNAELKNKNNQLLLEMETIQTQLHNEKQKNKNEHIR